MCISLKKLFPQSNPLQSYEGQSFVLKLKLKSNSVSNVKQHQTTSIQVKPDNCRGFNLILVLSALDNLLSITRSLATLRMEQNSA
ncbi:MAG: hypothetical protein CBD27_04225 [Rhodospirillaceae bacterium TMED167]|nr:hypothetical protein [Rhodospirillaceae bacterium]OUW28668.1 MAG: hypothetical protein CBD27_04225 [Rhodospirillaceae bacterium TMED167]